ncbi:DUF2793 domain-containing protein [Acuticoccus mangrovi]|uniref:DUF2793 domain-containing protein n=1 Tax=Acuticoccus mangrovi TaxID=2796142 RepID=A0A934IGZ4_9HYPH|nr:DUF2793 domain-containing protein [Acuticoccus mangrovi]MBJ3774811.1 DUF2793 domain-containing protein [Acuticoccus mangrovi]
MSNSLNLELPYVEAAQAQKHVTVNDAFRRIDAVVQLSVADRTLTTPPASPSEGDRHLVASGATGAWAGHDFELAAYVDGAWVFFAPVEGWLAFVRAEDALVYFTGAAWEILTGAAGAEATAKLGINGTADTTNRLVVNAEAALFAPDLSQPVPTGDVRIKASKSTSGDVASHVFQTDYSGRAEFGLIGSDDFSLKVSADGSSFAEAFSVDASTARLDFAKVPSVAGAVSFAFQLPSRADGASTAIPSDVEVVETRGFAAENDGGGGRYERVGSLPSDGLGFADGNGGYWALSGNVITLRQAGAKMDGTTDDTAAINLALGSGRSIHAERGTYLISDALATGATAQRIVGDGRGRTKFKVSPSFNMSALGVFRIDHPFVFLEDFEIEFDQSTASSRATLVAYPPAVYMVGRTRVRLSRLRFIEAWEGVDATGNTGGALFEDVESGSFNVGFRFDGALDTVELRNCRVWPYNFAANATLYDIYQDSETIGFRFGRVDDLKLSNCTPFQCRIILEEGADGHRPFGMINGLALDGSYSRIEMSHGDVAVTSLYATSADANDSFIVQTGGNLELSDFSFRCNEVSNVPMVHVNGTGANCQIQNGKCEFGPSTLADGFRVTTGQLSVSSVRFGVNSTAVRTGACIRQVGGDLSAIGNSCNGPTTGTGDFIAVATDGNHTIVANDSNGWGFSFPSTRGNGIYGPNHDGSKVVIDSVVTFGAVNDTTEGGEIRLEGAGTNPTMVIDTASGNVRVSSLATGKALQATGADGTASLGGRELRFSNGLAFNAGLANDVNSVALGALTLDATTSGNHNTAVGRQSLTALTSGSTNTALGSNAGSQLVSDSGNTFVGYNAGSVLTAGTGNTGVGRNAFTGVGSTISNASALGDGATVTGSNQVQLGNSSTTTYAYGAVQNRSDARDKTDVRETRLGLDFVCALRPVDFRWDYREDYRRPAGLDPDVEWVAPEAGSMVRERFHHGFLAQDVAAVIEQQGVDFGGYQDHAIAGGDDVKSIGYSELVAPIVRAIQEICVRLEALEAKG